MQRQIEITVPPEETENLLDLISDLDGLLGLRVQRGISIQPPGDTITTVLSNRSLHRLLRDLGARRIGADQSSSIITNEVASVIAPSARERTGTEVSDLSWEEIETEMGKESNMTANALLLMAISGTIGAVGISSGTLHVVIGAMIIAPGFEPITRFSLGLVTGGAAWKRGLADMAKGYAALIAGAILGSLLILLLGKPLGGGGAYLPAESLVEYWTTISGTSLLVSAMAGAAGAVLIASNRSVLTAGVLVALALIPTATLLGISAVAGEFQLFGRAFVRWALDVVLVAGMAALVFLWHGRRLGRRTSMY